MDITEVNWSFKLDGEDFSFNVGNETVVGCHWRSRLPKPKFVIIFCHGLAASIASYANFLREIPNHGGAALAADHIGHGRSSGLPGSTIYEEIDEEIKGVIRLAYIYYPTSPLILMGHSLGGLSVARFLISHTTETSMLKGAVIHAPWLSTSKSFQPSDFKMTVLNILSKVIPETLIDTGMRVANSPYPDGYKKEALASPYSRAKISLRFINSIFREMQYVVGHSQLYPHGLPTLFLQGTGDNCVDLGVNLKWIDEVSKLPNSNVTKKIFEGGPHELFKGWPRKQAFEALLAFCDSLADKNC